MKSERMTDCEFLLAVGDMLSDEEIRDTLGRLSEDEIQFVYAELPWLSEGPPWEGYAIQGSRQVWLGVDADGTFKEESL